MKFKIQNSKFKIFTLLLALLFYSVANAQSSPFTTYISDPNVNIPGQAFTIQNFFNLLIGLSCRFIKFGIIALGVMLIVYGLMFLMSRGDSTGFTNAKKAFGWGIVGGLVIMGVFTIILSVTAILGALTGKEVTYPITEMFNNC